mmetsp:Transcript_19809/g.46059  ORF Transcript_19809/g.46059 Transcript_19809/m.46059 type:complete len:544 (+) Transcript_19809:40-1671(+)
MPECSEDAEGAGEWTQLLAHCPDDVLQEELSRILGRLPADARERCLITVRQALEEELDGGVLDDDGTAAEAVRSSLQRTNKKISAAVAQAAPKEKVASKGAGTAGIASGRHPMAMPFRPAAKPADTEDGAGETPKGMPSAADDDGEAYPDSCSVYVANLPFKTDDVKVSNFFEDRCRPAQVLEVTFIKRPDGRPAGAAIIHFDNLDGAAKAIALNGKPGLEFRKLIVRADRGRNPKADNEGEVPATSENGNSDVGRKGGKRRNGKGLPSLSPRQEDADDLEPQGKAGRKEAPSVIVKNLAFDASEAHLGALFASVGEVAKVRIAKNAATGKAKGFAVVEFRTEAAVELALKCSGKEVRGRAVRIERMGNSAASSGNQPAGSHQRKAPELSLQLGIGDDSDSEDAEEDEEGGKPAKSSAMPATEPEAEGKRLREVEGDAAGAAEEPPAKKQCAASSEAAPQVESFPAGQEGLSQLASAASHAESAEALLAAKPLSELTGRLSSLGLKAGGTPLQRAERCWALRDVKDLDAIPKSFLAKPVGPKG